MLVPDRSSSSFEEATDWILTVKEYGVGTHLVDLATMQKRLTGLTIR